LLYLTPHRHIQGHLALRHKQPATNVHANGLAKLDPVSLGICAITINSLSTGVGALRGSRLGNQAQ
jgi:hypothetical protein